MLMPLSSLAIYLSPRTVTSIVTRYAGGMPQKSEFVTVFRSAETEAEADAAEVRERLAQAGIQAILVGDDAPGVVEGTWEVRVDPADRERAEAIASAPQPEPEDESEVSD